MIKLDTAAPHSCWTPRPREQLQPLPPRAQPRWIPFRADEFECRPPPRTVADLAPTPLREGDVPGQISEVNTPRNKHIARRSQFNDAVNQAIDAVRARGQGIDPEGPDRITDFDTYHSAVVTELRRRGYNAAHDGEELSVGRPGDDFNEQFDISTWQGRVRRFYAAYVSPPVWAEG